MSAITSSANGTYSDCGVGQGVGLAITCGGAACSILSQFPQLTCSHDPVGSSLNCNNGVQCPGQPNFQSIFQMQQHPDNSVTSQQLLQIDGQMFMGSDNGLGVVNYGPLMNGNPPSSSSSKGPAAGTSAVGGNSAAPSGTGSPAAGTAPGSQSLLVSPSAGTGRGTVAVTLSPSGGGSGTGGASGTSSPSIKAFVSSSSHRRPPVSKALFVLFVILSMFIGQSTAYHINISSKVGLQLLWVLTTIPVPFVYAQCSTIGAVPDITPEFAAFTKNGQLIVVETYSTIPAGTGYCQNGSFTATQGFSAVANKAIVTAPPVIISSLPTVVSHVYPAVAPEDIPAMGTVFEWIELFTLQQNYRRAVDIRPGAETSLFITLTPQASSSTSSSSSSTTSIPPTTTTSFTTTSDPPSTTSTTTSSSSSSTTASSSALSTSTTTTSPSTSTTSTSTTSASTTSTTVSSSITTSPTSSLPPDLPTCVVTGQIPGISAFFSPLTGPETISFVETYALSGTDACSLVPFTVYETLIGGSSTFTAPPVTIVEVVDIETYVFPGLVHSMLATLGPTITQTAVWRDANGTSIGGGVDYIVLAAQSTGISSTSATTNSNSDSPTTGTTTTSSMPPVTSSLPPVTTTTSSSSSTSSAGTSTSSSTSPGSDSSSAPPSSSPPVISTSTSIFPTTSSTSTTSPSVITSSSTSGPPQVSSSSIPSSAVTSSSPPSVLTSSGSSTVIVSQSSVTSASSSITPSPPSTSSLPISSTPSSPPPVLTSSGSSTLIIISPPTTVTSTSITPSLPSTSSPSQLEVTSTPLVISVTSESISVPPTQPSVTVITPSPSVITSGSSIIVVTTPSPTPTNSNIQIVSNINSLFPAGNAALLAQVEQKLCQTAVLPAINSVVSGEITRARGVTDLVQACIQLIDGAEPKAGTAQDIFQLALGNIVLCDKLANTILSGPLIAGRSAICNVIVPGIPA